MRRIGETRDRTVDVRVLAATHRDLQLAINESRFRQDLFYRLAVLTVHLPPLRERGEDLHLLLVYLGRAVIKEQGAGPVSMTQAALRAMERYDWPGNVREVRNVLTQMMVFSEGEVLTADDLPPFIRGLEDENESDAVFGIDGLPLLPDEGIELDAYLANVQKSLIEQARDRTNGNKAAAAKLLGLKRPTLIDRKNRLDIDWE